MSDGADPLRLHRNGVLGLLLVAAAAAWSELLWQAGGSNMAGMAMSSPTMGMQAPLFLAVWIVMMVAMMFPTAAPMILMFHRVQTNKRERGDAFVATWVFVAAYMAVWTVSGVIAYAAAVAAETLAVHFAISAATAARIGGAVLLIAGLYQFTPLKDVCLSQCRTPLSFIMTSWRDGATGAIRMGLLHGTYCLGCCWLLFLIMFPLGIMNVAAMALITVFVFAEKTAPWGRAAVRAIAALLVAYGAVVLAAPQLLPTYIAMSVAAPTEPAASDPNFRLELAELRPLAAGNTSLAVRLVNVPDGEPVKGAVLLDAATDMGPGGMPDMIGKVTVESSEHPGLHRFQIETGMAGKWQLVIAVKVPGQAEPVRATLTYNVVR